MPPASHVHPGPRCALPAGCALHSCGKTEMKLRDLVKSRASDSLLEEVPEMTTKWQQVNSRSQNPAESSGSLPNLSLAKS